MDRWNTPFLSVLTGTDKDALQQIFTSLQAELGRLNRRIADLENAINPNVSKERKGY
jgi:uncharacterized protein YlxW (UPF0749 family)